MLLDFAVGGLIFLAGLFGYWRGALRQGVHLGALVLMVVLAPTVAPWLAPWIASHLPELGPRLVDLLALLAAAVAVFVLTAIGGHLVLWALRPEQVSPLLARLNRLAGLLLGVAKGGAVSLLILAALAALPPSVMERYPASIQSTLGSSATLYWVRQWNVVDWTRAVKAMADLIGDARPTEPEHPDIDQSPEPPPPPPPRVHRRRSAL